MGNVSTKTTKYPQNESDAGRNEGKDRVTKVIWLNK